VRLFGGMKIYTVHVLPDRARAYEQPVFVREGFHFFAFLFTFFWALYERLWWHAAAILLANASVMALGKALYFTPPSIAILQFCIQLFVGFYAHDWQRARLGKRGYIMADIAAADSLLRAQQRFFERHLAAA
jgi:drug/metabolite transporter (DMT)-like permease